MTKQTKTYLLLGSVLLIWGVIAFKVFGALHSEVPEVAPSVAPKLLQPKLALIKDTFRIKADYRDPFLGTVPRKKVAATKKIQKQKAPEIDIHYTGSILNSTTNKRIFFVTIAGTQYLMHPNETQMEVTLLSGNEKRIRIRHKNQITTIALQP